MEQLSPQTHEKELPAPYEKLLRSPAFWERQGKTAKWLAIGSIIFFVLILASTIIIRLLKPTTTQPTQPPVSTVPTTTPISPDPTANWQTYTNEKYGFEVKYPPDLQIETSELAESCLGCADGYKFKPTNIQITIGGSMTWEVVKNQLIEGINGKNVDIAINKSGGISREGKATKFSRFPQFEGQEIKEIILNKEGIIFDFFTTKTEEIIFNQMISTFKFLDQNPKK